MNLPEEAIPRDVRPFELWASVPLSLRSVLLNVTWDRKRLHDLDLPVEDVPLSELRWQLDLPWWSDNGQYFRVSPNQVRVQPERFAKQWHRTMAADLRYPIDVLQRDRLVLLDGVHRLLRADMEGRPTIAIHRISMTVFKDLLIRDCIDQR